MILGYESRQLRKRNANEIRKFEDILITSSTGFFIIIHIYGSVLYMLKYWKTHELLIFSSVNNELDSTLVYASTPLKVLE